MTMNARKKRQIDAELALMGMQATDGPGQYVTVQIEGPDGPEVYTVWACVAGAPVARRNPSPRTARLNPAERLVDEKLLRMSEEHPWKISKTQLLPSGRSRSVTLGFVMADNIVEAHQRAVAAGHIPATAKSSPGDVYDDTATVRDGKNGSWHIEIVWEQEDGQPRPNPPLSEHMAHESLYDIAVMLAPRFAQSESPAAAFRSFVNRLTHETAIAVARAGRSDEDSSLDPMIDAVMMATTRSRR
jgi:hypothetical protein